MIIERRLRDESDASGQSMRQWRVELDGEQIYIRRDEESEGRLLLRLADVGLFLADIKLLIAARP
ncbi:MAG: hypothetical protein RLZZ09_2262 [Pseudomonadota bacterium]|jgi:hypothetical protein